MAIGGRASPRKLPRGGSALDPQSVGRIHRERLHAAVIEQVSERGIAETTVDHLTTAAGLSTSGFYALYGGKRECVVAVWDVLMAELEEQLVTAAQRARDTHTATTPTPAGVRDQLGEVIGALCDLAVRQPATARILLQEAGALGADGPDRRQRVVAALQQQLGRATAVPMDPVACAIVAAGTVAVVEQRLRSGKPRSLRSAAPELAAWGAGYDHALPDATPAGSNGAPTPADRPRLGALPHGVHRLPRAFVDRHQRARILEATRELTAENGYADLTLTQVTTRARISNRTFYEHFSDVQAAFAAAFEEIFTDLFARAYYSAAAHERWSDAVNAGIEGLVDGLSANPETARFILHDARSAGRAIGATADDALSAFATLLTRGRTGARVPAVVPFAIVAGITSVAGEAVLEDRLWELTQLTPRLCYLALVPFVGDDEARRAARLESPPRVGDAIPEPTLDREPLLTAFLELVEEQGFAATRLEDVARRAGVSTELVQDAFLEETYLASAALDHAADAIVAAMADAFVSAGDDLALATHRALGAMLGALAAAPAVAQLAVLDLRGLDEAADARRERFFGMFGDVIGPRLPQLPPQPEVVLRIIADGIVELVGRYANEGRLDELMQALPEISRRSLTPFFDTAEAERVAVLHVPVVPPQRRT